jgi:hypothetical protein
MGAGVLLSEAVHSFAHWEASVESGHNDQPHAEDGHHQHPDSHGVMNLVRENGDAHPHLDIRSTVPGSTSLKSLTLALPFLELPLLNRVSVSRIINVPSSSDIFVREHGPPPPSRAPPLSLT